MALLLCLCASEGFAEPLVAAVRASLPMRPGTQMVFRARATDHPMRPMVEEDFALDILETWPAGVTFRYSVEQKVIGTESGIQTLSSLDVCTTLDPWWDPGETSFDDRCEFWIPQHVFREIAVLGKSYLSIDTLARRDSVVRWELKERTDYLLEIDGRAVRLAALVIRTSRDDTVIVLDDPRNPLILAIRSTYFEWELTEIYTHAR